VTDARGYTTVYDYDDLGRLTMERPPQSDYYWLPPYGRQYEYANTLGSQLTKVRKPDQIDYNQSPPQPTYVDINYTYDKMGRVGLMMGPAGEYGFYGYDINSQLTAGLDPLYAMLVGGTDYLLWWEWGYDADGRMTRELLWTTGSATLHKFAQRSVQYDAAGRRTKQGFHSDNRTGYLALDTTQSYSYDPDKKWLKTIARDGSSNEGTTYTYDSANGRLTRMDYGNGAHVEYTYFGSGAVKKISHLSTTGTLIASVEYDYDLAGNVLSVVLDDSLRYPGDATISYTYDDLHRLTRETCVPSQGSYRVPYDYRYTYDPVGNRTGKTDGTGFGRYETEYSYSARNELLGEGTYRVEEDEQGEENWVYVGGWSYAYDLRGNMVKKGDPGGYWWWVYTWSADDKLLKREFHDDYGSEERTKVEYKYDLLGRRIAKRVTPAYGAPGPWRWYFYDGLQVTAEGTGTSDKIYYTHSPSAIGGIICRDASTGGGQKLWYHFDRLGSVMAVTDSNGNPYAVYGMEAFGYTLQMGSSTGYAIFQPDPQPYHLTTKEYDPDTGLYYFSARWYDPSTGRFLSRGKLPSFVEHPFVYVGGNPVKAADPTGRNEVIIRPPSEAEWDCIGEGKSFKYDDDTCRCSDYNGKTWLGCNLEEVCKKAGHSKWANCVRNCLLCYWGFHGDQRLRKDHKECYWGCYSWWDEWFGNQDTAIADFFLHVGPACAKAFLKVL